MEHRVHGGGLLIRSLTERLLARLVSGGGVLGAAARLLAALAALRGRLARVDAAVAASAGHQAKALREEWAAFRAALANVESAAGEIRRALRL